MIYCTYQNAVENGFTSNESIFNNIAEISSRFIDSITGNIFYPLQTTFNVDGLNLPFQPLKYSIINIDQLSIIYIDSIYSYSDIVQTKTVNIDPSNYVIYNAQNPNVDYSPRIAFINNKTFPEGFQNIVVEGLFGCVIDNPDFNPLQPEDPITNPRYIAPALIRKACMHLVLLNEFPVNDPRHLIIRRSNYLTEEVTDYHKYKLSDNISPSQESITGDNVVDNILEMYSFNSVVRVV